MGEKIIDEGKLSLNVESSVVSHLSIGLYKNFSRAIKELVSNAYDALATEVKINLDLKSKRLIIKDNGNGMNLEEIKKKLLTIGKITPRTNESIGLGRRRIGQFGVGFLAVFPYCKTIKVISKKKGEENVIEVTIDVSKYFQNNSWTLDGKKEDINYQIKSSLLAKDKGESIVVLENIKEHIVGQLKKNKGKGHSTIEQFGGFEKTKWELQQYLPIQYHDSNNELKNYFEVKNRIPLRVWFDGDELFRNVPDGENNKISEIIEKGEERFGSINVKYVIMSPYTTVRPQEARGFQIRLNDVGVGLPTDFDVIKLKGRLLGKLNYLAGEIHIVKGLDSDLMLHRDGFSFTEEVSKMQEFFRDKLTKWDNQFQITAKDDKAVYQTISQLPNKDKIAQEFKSAGIIKFDKTNLRILKSPITKKGKSKISSVTKQIDSIVSNKGFVLEKRKGTASSGKSIEVDKKAKKVIVYEDDPSLQDVIKIDKIKFNVKYEEWQDSKGADTLCHIDSKNHIVVFNKNHSIFNTSLDNKVLMELIIRLQLIVKPEGMTNSTLNKIYDAIEKTFQR